MLQCAPAQSALVDSGRGSGHRQELTAATYHYTTTPGAKVSLNFTGELHAAAEIAIRVEHIL